jgi:hypothetical protein
MPETLAVLNSAACCGAKSEVSNASTLNPPNRKDNHG